MKNSRIVFTALISLGFFGFYQQPVAAGCTNYEAIGWFTDISTGKRSKDIVGTSFRCGSAYSSGGGFRSTDLNVSTAICVIEEMCTDPSFELNTTYVSVSNGDSIVNERSEGEVISFTRDSITVKAENSLVSYTWLDGKYIPCYGCQGTSKVN